MLTVSVNYLMGRAVAREYYDDESVPEWPPHPCRLFSAMVASWGNGDRNKPEADALKWLEKQSLPEIAACEVKTAAAPTLFSARSDKPEVNTEHYFPRVVLSNPNVFFIWENADKGLAEHKPALKEIAERIPYLGTSMSPVTVSVCDSCPEPENLVRYVPDKKGEKSLRVARKGRFDELCETYSAADGEFPVPASPTFSYTEKNKNKNGNSPPVCSAIFENDPSKAVVLGFTPDTDKDPKSSLAYLRHCLKLSDILRKAMIAQADKIGVSSEAKEIISGHPADSAGKTEKPHLARIPLANIGWKHSDGKLFGFALLFPKMPHGKPVFGEVKKVAKEVKQLTVGGFGVWNVEIVDDPEYHSPQQSLGLSRYFKPSKLWMTVTPAQFETLPNRPNSNQSYKILHKSFERLGLPEPVFGRSRQSQHSPISGVPRSQDFNVQDFRRAGDRRPWTHLAVEFGEPVAGPVVVGALRFFGLGLMMPVLEN